ncbi:MAG TPA: SUMF1/EgtB/PvdO family nonheme iron enzyme [Prosthecobacter sp.]|nr:SUMF1/EgtB/PvdO family nonheme iron enzyme [Prosthecobacter sp.]
MIHLVGSAAGFGAKPQEVEDFLRTRPDFLAQRPALRAALGDCNGISYTQWEAFMALDRGVPLFVADDTFERPAGFLAEAAEIRSQELHLQRLREAGVDRGSFETSDGLCIEVLRSMSRLLHSTGSAADRDSAADLEAFAPSRERSEAEDAHSIFAPLLLDLALPAHLLVGQSLSVEFALQEPGHTPLENILLAFDIGGSRVTAQRSHLARGQSVPLIADEALVLKQEGTPTMQLTVSCERSCLKEKFTWQEVANVITAETLLSRTGFLSRSRPRPRRIRLEMTEDKLPLGFHYRLPTEAEWEFSCRAGDESVPQTASSRASTEAPIAHAISTFQLDGNRGANRFGLCDMTGNVFQWCLDHYGPYPAAPEVDPCREREARNRVIRGGSWHDPAPLRRPAARMQCAPETRSSRIGFRVVLARV